MTLQKHLSYYGKGFQENLLKKQNKPVIKLDSKVKGLRIYF